MGDPRALRDCRAFYRTYPQIRGTLSREFENIVVVAAATQTHSLLNLAISRAVCFLCTSLSNEFPMFYKSLTQAFFSICRSRNLSLLCPRSFSPTREKTLSSKNSWASLSTTPCRIERFDALIGYLRLRPDTLRSAPHLEKVPQIRLLVRINVDEIMEQYHQRGRLFWRTPDVPCASFRKDCRCLPISPKPFTRRGQAGIRQFAEDCGLQKIEIRAHPTKRLHADLPFTTQRIQ